MEKLKFSLELTLNIVKASKHVSTEPTQEWKKWLGFPFKTYNITRVNVKKSIKK